MNLTIFNGSNRTSGKFSLDSHIDKTLLKVEVLVMTSVLVLALIGNTTVIMTLMVRSFLRNGQNKSKNKISRMNFFIFHLSAADIYVSLGNILTMLLWRKNNNIFFGGDLACRMVVYFQLVSVYYSTYVLVIMSIDRYEAICKPLIGLSWSKKRGLTYIAIAFFISHLQGIPQIWFFARRPIPNSEPEILTCFAIFNPPILQNVYIVYTWLMQFLIPLCVILYCYLSISVKVIDSFKIKKTSVKNDKNSHVKAINHETKRKPSNFSINKFAYLEDENSMRLLNVDDKRQNDTKRISICSNISRSNTSLNNANANKVINLKKKEDHTSFRQHRSSKSLNKSKIKTIKLTLSVIVLYIICSTPYFLGMILNLVLNPEQFMRLSNFSF